MLEELKQQSLRVKGSVMHPKISFVLFHKGDGFCLKHSKQNGMNVGSMRQHLRGKAHNVDPETGNSLNEIDFSEIIKESQNQESIKSKRELFLDYYEMVPKLCALKDRGAAVMIVNHIFEGQMRTDMRYYLYLLHKNDKSSNQYSESMTN